LSIIFEVWLGTLSQAVFVKVCDLTILLRGPPLVPAIVTTGIAVLFSIEFGVVKATT